MSAVTDSLADVQAGSQMYDIASGNQSRSRSIEAAYIAKEREAKLQQMSSTLKGTNTSNDRAEEELTLLRGKVKDMEIKQNTNDGYRAYQAYDGGDSSYLNKHMKNTIPDVADVQSISSDMSKTDPESFHKALEALKTTPEAFDSLSDDEKKSLLKGYKVVTLNGGEKVINNVENWLASSGIGGMLKTQEIDNLNNIEAKRQAAMTPKQKAIDATNVGIAGMQPLQDFINTHGGDPAYADIVKAMKIKLGSGAAAKAMTPKEASEARTADLYKIPTNLDTSGLWKDALANGDKSITVNGETLSVAEIAQVVESESNPLGESQKKYIYTIPSALDTIEEVKTELENMTDDEYNIMIQAKSYLQKFTGGMIVDEDEVNSKLLGINAQAKTALLDYVTMKTGAAFSKDEFASYESLLFSPLKTRKANIATTEGMLVSARNTADGVLEKIKRTHPATYIANRRGNTEVDTPAPGVAEKPEVKKDPGIVDKYLDVAKNIFTGKLELSTDEQALKEQYWAQSKVEGVDATKFTEEDFNRRIAQYREKAK